MLNVFISAKGVNKKFFINKVLKRWVFRNYGYFMIIDDENKVKDKCNLIVLDNTDKSLLTQNRRLYITAKTNSIPCVILGIDGEFYCPGYESLIKKYPILILGVVVDDPFKSKEEQNNDIYNMQKIDLTVDKKICMIDCKGDGDWKQNTRILEKTLDDAKIILNYMYLK